jgi:hypothetical protein
MLSYEGGFSMKSRENRFLLVEYLGDQLNIVEGELYREIKKILYDQRRLDGIRGGLDRLGEISSLSEITPAVAIRSRVRTSCMCEATQKSNFEHQVRGKVNSTSHRRRNRTCSTR